jgi:hypothetical protein
MCPLSGNKLGIKRVINHHALETRRVINHHVVISTHAARMGNVAGAFGSQFWERKFSLVISRETIHTNPHVASVWKYVDVARSPRVRALVSSQGYF